MAERETPEQIAAEYWKKIDGHLPPSLTDRQKSWIKSYLRAQVAVVEQDLLGATKIFTRLDKEAGFQTFEDQYPEYFATMEEVAGRKTQRPFAKILFRREDL